MGDAHMDWDDLRIFLHLARTGRMSGAGRRWALTTPRWAVG